MNCQPGPNTEVDPCVAVPGRIWAPHTGWWGRVMSTVPGRIWAPHTGWWGLVMCVLYLGGYGHPILVGGGWSCVYCTWEDMGTPYWLVGAGRLVCPLWKVDLHEKQPPCLLLHFNVYYRTCQCCGYKYTEFGSGS